MISKVWRSLVKNWFLILAAVSMVGAAPAAEDKKPAKPAAAAAKSEPAAKPASTKGPKIVVEPATHDFGKALQNKTLTKEFSLKNLGNEDLVVGELGTSCGCTVAQLATKTLKPGASTPLIVNLETRTYQGRLERTITIPSNDTATKALEVKVMAEVSAPEAAK
jgi:hypothetical protein